LSEKAEHFGETGWARKMSLQEHVQSDTQDAVLEQTRRRLIDINKVFLDQKFAHVDHIVLVESFDQIDQKSKWREPRRVVRLEPLEHADGMFRIANRIGKSGRTKFTRHVIGVRVGDEIDHRILAALERRGQHKGLSIDINFRVRDKLLNTCNISIS